MATVGRAGAEMEVMVGRHARLSHEGCSYFGRCRSNSLVRYEETDDRRSHQSPNSRCQILGWIETEFVGLPEKALVWGATRRHWLVVHAVGSLHSIVLHGLTCDEEAWLRCSISPHFTPYVLEAGTRTAFHTTTRNSRVERCADITN